MRKLKIIIGFLLINGIFLMNVPLTQAAAVTWTQTDWSGGSGQANWSVINKYNSRGEDGVYDTSTTNQLKMKINASVVVGQPDFVSGSQNQGGSATANTLLISDGVFSYGTKLFIGDTNNNRVLIYNTIPTSNNASADVVIGQVDMVHNLANQGGVVSANTLKQPTSIYYDGSKLFIADAGNSRVLIYNTIPTSNNASADVVVGQPNMATAGCNTGGIGPNTICFGGGPIYGSIYSDGTHLFIAENGNNRVLVYNTIPISNNASADVVVGQVDFTHSGAGITANTLNIPNSVSSDGVKVFILDSGNQRALIYNSIPISNNAPADIVIGQTDMTSNGPNSGGLSKGLQLSRPSRGFIASKNGKLFISDGANHRILIYNSIPNINWSSADIVIGQDGFSTNNSGLSSVSMNYPRDVYYDGQRLLVADSNNSRVLIFSGPHSSTLTSSTYGDGTPYTWGPLTYTATTPENTAVSFEVSTDDGSTWEAVTNNTTQTFGPSNTVAYRATLSNTDGISTPTLTNVSISGNLVPTVTTAPATATTRGGATLNGEITATGGTDATERGFKYGLDTSYEDNVFEAPGPYSTGIFTTDLTSLHCGKTYHAQAYATNIAGTSYGEDITFTIPSCIWSSGGGGGGTIAPIVTHPSVPVPVPVPAPAPTPSCFITQTLRRGSMGEEVKCLQTKLNANLVIDGRFGPLTKASVIHFQLTNQLVGDGIVGPLTRRVLNK